jgi:hypothetical protein
LPVFTSLAAGVFASGVNKPAKSNRVVGPTVHLTKIGVSVSGLASGLKETPETMPAALPAPTWERFARTRVKEVALSRLGAGEELLHANVGPTAIVGDQLWFGPEFYDAEGKSGVGGVGMLDPPSGLLVRYPPAMADWSVATVAAEDSVLWLGLAFYGEAAPRQAASPATRSVPAG